MRPWHLFQQLRPGSTSAVAGLAMLGLLTFLLRELQIEWRVNPQYSYGWGVPLLALYLLGKRWSTRPLPEPPQHRSGAAFMAGTLLVLLAPARLISEANPDWRLITWVLALCVTGLLLVVAYWSGGRRWAGHFLFPIAFLLLAVPWPARLEEEFTHTLMRGVVSLTSETMNWLGVAAWTSGNVIELPGGAVGVNEACSGLRSFQTMLMLGLFLGELYRLALWPRLIAVALGWFVALTLNVLRTSVLTWICARFGPAVEARYHDAAGYVALYAGVTLLWLFVRWLPRSQPSPAATSQTHANWGREQGVPRMISAAVLLYLLAVESSVEWWYRAREPATPPRAHWTIAWPEPAHGFSPRAVGEEVQRLLRCDEASSGVWRRSDGSEWTMFYLRWLPGRMAAPLARGHTPDVCLPANGFTQQEPVDNFVAQVGPVRLPFTSYVFDRDGRRYHVFFCLLDDQGGWSSESAREAARSYLAELKPARRLQAAWAGKRHRGQQVLEIAITGYHTKDQARQAVREMLPALIRVARQSSSPDSITEYMKSAPSGSEQRALSDTAALAKDAGYGHQRAPMQKAVSNAG